jgi:hypothetical protein
MEWVGMMKIMNNRKITKNPNKMMKIHKKIIKYLNWKNPTNYRQFSHNNNMNHKHLKML